MLVKEIKENSEEYKDLTNEDSSETSGFGFLNAIAGSTNSKQEQTDPNIKVKIENMEYKVESLRKKIDSIFDRVDLAEKKIDKFERRGVL